MRVFARIKWCVDLKLKLYLFRGLLISAKRYHLRAPFLEVVLLQLGNKYGDVVHLLFQTARSLHHVYLRHHSPAVRVIRVACRIYL